MKRGKKLLVLLLALIVLGAGAWAATSLNAEDDNTDTAESGEVVLTADTLTSLSWAYGDAELSFTYADGWTYTPDSTFPLDESFLETIAEALTEVVANKVIEEPGDLAQFGLEEPVCTVTVNGTATLLLGNESTMGGEVYLSTGDGKVYLTDSSLLDCFAHTLSDLAVQQDTNDPTENSTAADTVSP